MRNREFVLALAIVGAVAWTARAGDDRTTEERIAALEAQCGPRERTALPLGARCRDIEHRLDQLERRAKPEPRRIPSASDGRDVVDLEDPRSLEAPEGAPERASVLLKEWLAAYHSALMKQMEVGRFEHAGGDPASHADELRLAREDLTALITACERAREAYRAAAK